MDHVLFQMRVSFSAFNLEACDCDYVQIYDGATTMDTLLLKEYGSTVPEPVYTSSNAVYISFTTSFVVHKTGFFSTVEVYQGMKHIFGEAVHAISYNVSIAQYTVQYNVMSTFRTRNIDL